MAKCKTKDCVKEAASGSEYCPACNCKRDKKRKTITEIVIGTCTCIGIAVAALFKSSDKNS